MSNKQKYKPGVKITMNRFHKFWVGTTTVLLTAVMLTSCGECQRSPPVGIMRSLSKVIQFSLLLFISGH
ncbi:MAG: hypothetical protein ACKPFK_33065, partial [Dolichospermum sp.]